MDAKWKAGLLLRGFFRAIPVVFVLVLLLSQVVLATITTVASGMYTPENISIAPDGFGGYGGDYFIPDAGNISIPNSGSVWVIDKTTGSASQFVTSSTPELARHPLGGLFLPEGWGNNSGKYLVSGYNDAIDPNIEDITNPDRYRHGYISTFDSDGNAELLLDYLNEGGSSLLCDPIIAPDGFGDYAGKLIVTDQQGSLLWYAKDGSYGELVDFVNGPSPNYLNPFGITLAADGFGSVGGTLLVSEAGLEAGYDGPRIVSVDSSGGVSDFATINLFNGQMRLRQMSMAPDGFLADIGIGGRVLLVSVTASQYGGGLGTLLALNGNGEVVAHLKTGTALEKFDPRGMLVTDDWSLLISDASDPIILAQAEDFVAGAPTAVPEPCSMITLGMGCLGLIMKYRRSKK
jgi:hypothetical protein